MKPWNLDPRITFLNHGSFGACPVPVLEHQATLRARLESEPVRFFERELEPLWQTARDEVAKLCAADPRDVVFVTNTTTAVSTVLRSLRLSPGDELLTTNQAYGACVYAARTVAEQTGAKLVLAEVPFPIQSSSQVVEAVMEKVTERTRFALIDHICSPTGLIFPVAELCEKLTARGVEVMIDGAHAPGQLPLDIPALKATWYAGNLHKWVCAPKSAALLWTHRDAQERTRPLVLSNASPVARGDRSRYQAEFDWAGTGDPTAVLCVPEALRALSALAPGGLEEVMRRNHAMALEARDLLCATLKIEKPAPDEMVGSLAAFPLPISAEGFPHPAHDALFHTHHIEVPVWNWPKAPQTLLRISAQRYNTHADYEKLAHALPEVLRRFK